jgi:hypothetical protein
MKLPLHVLDDDMTVEQETKNGKLETGDWKPDCVLSFSRFSVSDLRLLFIPQALHHDALISADRHYSYLKASIPFRDLGQMGVFFVSDHDFSIRTIHNARPRQDSPWPP